MKYRSRLDITAEILAVANDGALKTRIMYVAYLSYGQVKEYIATLIENGLLEFDAKQKVYKTTDRGREFLAKYNKLKI
jgi:predicted transcriptional regulator